MINHKYFIFHQLKGFQVLNNVKFLSAQSSLRNELA